MRVIRLYNFYRRDGATRIRAMRSAIIFAFRDWPMSPLDMLINIILILGLIALCVLAGIGLGAVFTYLN